MIDVILLTGISFLLGYEMCRFVRNEVTGWEITWMAVYTVCICALGTLVMIQIGE